MLQQYNNPQGWMMLGGLLVVLVLLRISGSSKGKITTGKLCGNWWPPARWCRWLAAKCRIFGEADKLRLRLRVRPGGEKALKVFETFRGLP